VDHTYLAWSVSPKELSPGSSWTSRSYQPPTPPTHQTPLLYGCNATAELWTRAPPKVKKGKSCYGSMAQVQATDPGKTVCLCTLHPCSYKGSWWPWQTLSYHGKEDLRCCLTQDQLNDGLLQDGITLAWSQRTSHITDHLHLYFLI
jgi:hypothetical protein